MVGGCGHAGAVVGAAAAVVAGAAPCMSTRSSGRGGGRRPWSTRRGASYSHKLTNDHQVKPSSLPPPVTRAYPHPHPHQAAGGAGARRAPGRIDPHLHAAAQHQQQQQEPAGPRAAAHAAAGARGDRAPPPTPGTPAAPAHWGGARGLPRPIRAAERQHRQRRQQ